MTSEVVTITRLKWYGAVIGAFGCWLLMVRFEGLEASDFTAGCLAAVLFMPLVFRDSGEKGRA